MNNMKEIKGLLKERGYPITSEDEYFDSMTQRFVKAFQSDNGLKTTGIVDEDTYETLRKKQEIFKEEIITREEIMPEVYTPMDESIPDEMKPAVAMAE